MAYSTIQTRHDHETGWITFNRPEIHNAFNSTLISEMAGAFSEMENDAGIRVGILTGAGKSFCAGADLNWMRGVITQSFDENLAESHALADLFWQIRRGHTMSGW